MSAETAAALLPLGIVLFVAIALVAVLVLIEIRSRIDAAPASREPFRERPPTKDQQQNPRPRSRP